MAAVLRIFSETSEERQAPNGLFKAFKPFDQDPRESDQRAALTVEANP